MSIKVSNFGTIINCNVNYSALHFHGFYAGMYATQSINMLVIQLSSLAILLWLSSQFCRSMNFNVIRLQFPESSVCYKFEGAELT